MNSDTNKKLDNEKFDENDDNSLSDQPTHHKSHNSTTSEKEITLGLELLNIDSCLTSKMYEDYFIEKLMNWQ
jgi:hypothetical protein